MRFIVAAALGFVMTVPSASFAEQVVTGSVTKLPIPRFVSLKPDDAPVREGPGTDHHVKWVFKRGGLPVEVTAEFDNWRRVRDSEGAEGWIFHARLSGKRTVMVQSKTGEAQMLHVASSAESRPTARLEPGVIAEVEHCDGEWCSIHGDGFEGYMRQERLWGVYIGEVVGD